MVAEEIMRPCRIHMIRQSMLALGIPSEDSLADGSCDEDAYMYYRIWGLLNELASPKNTKEQVEQLFMLFTVCLLEVIANRE